MTRQELHSNVVKIKVSSPQGTDKKAWDQLKEDPKSIEFLHSYNLSSRPGSVLRVAGILESFPKSNYSATLEQSLRQLYHRRATSLEPKVRHRIAKLLDIHELEEYDDKRFEQIVRLGKDRIFVLKSALEELSKQTEVPLAASPDLKNVTIDLAKGNPHTLGLCMKAMSYQLEASWRRKDKGYFLSK